MEPPTETDQKPLGGRLGTGHPSPLAPGRRGLLRRVQAVLHRQAQPGPTSQPSAPEGRGVPEVCLEAVEWVL